MIDLPGYLVCPMENRLEYLKKALEQQAIEDDAYLDEVMQQISQMSAEELSNIPLSSGPSDLRSFGPDYIYVDKTGIILNALNKRWLFLARPRRMGKSLTLSTASVMSQEVYLQSIYPEHQLHPVLQNTFFAQNYSDGTAVQKSVLGAPYNISLSFKDLAVKPELKDRAKLEKDRAELEKDRAKLEKDLADTQETAGELQNMQQDLMQRQQMLEQEFLDNAVYRSVCEELKQVCLNNPDQQIAFALYNQLSFSQQEQRRAQILTFLVVLDNETAKANCQLIDSVNAKLEEIKDKINLYLVQKHDLEEQLKSVNTELKEIQAKRNDLEAKFNQKSVRSSEVFGYASDEELGQLRKQIIRDFCQQIRIAVQANTAIISALKNEILANSPDYQQGLDLIENQIKLNEQRMGQLDKISQQILSYPNVDTVYFTGFIRKLLSCFEVGDLSFFIDEYDGCLINSLDISSVANYICEVMGEFYSTLKEFETSKYIRILFVTGVTAFAKVSLFSGANNIKDITYDPDFYDIVGFTEHEIKRSFALLLCKHAILTNSTPQEIVSNLALYYDGYHFVLPQPNVLVAPIFNSLAVTEALSQSIIRYKNYWIRSGTTLSQTVLQLLTQISSDQLTQTINQALNGGVEVIVSEDAVDVFSSMSFIDIRKDAKFLMYQAGYLTIDFSSSIRKQYVGLSQLDETQRVVVLTPPNKEVRDFLKQELVDLVRNYNKWRFGEKVEPLISDEVRNNISIVEQGRLTLILKPFADYDIGCCEYSFNQMLGQYAVDINDKAVWENFLRNILFTCIKENIGASGNHKLLHAETEVPVSAGRVDLVVTNERDKIKFIFEFKRVDETDPNPDQIKKALNKASNQINSHNYTAQIGYTVIAIAGAFFRNIKQLSPNGYEVGYHICLREVKKVHHAQ